jgi:hypothetical protein
MTFCTSFNFRIEYDILPAHPDYFREEKSHKYIRGKIHSRLVFKY